MRRFNFWIFLLTVISFVGCRNESFTIHGDLHQINSTKVYLVHQSVVENSYEIIDSSDVHEGHFEFKGAVKYPIACGIKIGTKTTINLLVENSQIYITGSVRIPEEIKVKGSSADSDYRKLIQESENILSHKNKMWAEMVKQNKTQNDSIVSTEDSLLGFTKQFVVDNPQSIGAAYFVYYLYLDRNIDINKLEPIIKSFDSSISGSEYILYLEREILLRKPMKEGDKAPDFQIKSIKSDSLYSLKDFKKKYLYIDFSASWLSNFEERKNHLKDLKQTFGDSLDILTIYLDVNKKDLSMRTKGVIWHEGCNYDYWECVATKQYSVNRIPYGFLIQNGKFVAINPDMSNFSNLMK